MKIVDQFVNCKRKIPSCALPRFTLSSLYRPYLPLNHRIFVFDSKLAIQSLISDKNFLCGVGDWPLRSQTMVNFSIVSEIYENSDSD